MSENETLMAYLLPKLTAQVENAATDALGYILNRSAGSREALDRLLQDGGFSVPPIVRVETQVTYEDGSRPDMAGYDEADVKRLLVEAKFWATLLAGQASGYLGQFDHSEPAVLLFLAPEVRMETLWTEIARQIEEDKSGTRLTSVVTSRGCRSSLVKGTKKRVMLCCCLAIPSTLTAKRKCPHYGECDIDAARAGKTSGTQQLTGRVYDNRAGSDVDGSEHTPHQAHTGGIRRGRSSRTSSRQSRSQTCQRYTERIGERSSTSGAQPIRRSQP